MLPLALTASPEEEHPPDEMPGKRVEFPKFLVCSTVPSVLIWATPPGLFVPANAGTEIQNEAPPIVVVCGFHTGCSRPPLGIPPKPRGIGILLPGGGAPVRVTCGGPLTVEKRFPNAGVSALLAARICFVRGEKAISSTRVVPPVAIVCWKSGAAGLVAL